MGPCNTKEKKKQNYNNIDEDDAQYEPQNHDKSMETRKPISPQKNKQKSKQQSQENNNNILNNEQQNNNNHQNILNPIKNNQDNLVLQKQQSTTNVRQSQNTPQFNLMQERDSFQRQQSQQQRPLIKLQSIDNTGINLDLNQQIGQSVNFSKQNNNINNNKRNSNQNSNNNLASKDFILQREGDIKDHYAFLGIIGQGITTQVVKAIHKKTGNLYAIKICQKCHKNINLQNQFLREAQFSAQFDHPHIIKVLEVYQDKQKFYLVNELCQGGDLFDKVLKNGNITETIASSIMIQIMSALYYCHSNNIVHRDLKPENILYESEDMNSLKIIDFGTSTKFSSQEQQELTRQVGTLLYMAPEVLDKNLGYDYKCDIWSAGIILYVILVGHPPFFAHTYEEQLKLIQTEKLTFQQEEFNKISQEAKDLLKGMLDINPFTRFTALTVLNHPWIIKQQQKLEQQKQNLFLKQRQKQLENQQKQENLQQNGFTVQEKDNKYCLEQSQTTLFANNTQNKTFLEKQQYENWMKSDISLSQKFNNNIDQESQKNNLKEALQNLKTFKTRTKLQQALFIFITNFLQNQEEKQELIATFEELDVNRDGILTADELYQGYLKFMSPEKAEREVKKVLKQVNIQQNEGINYSEFVMANQLKEILESKKKLEQAFHLFDTDNSGQISVIEIQKQFGQASQKIDEDSWEEFLKQIDTDHNGYISFTEFKNMLVGYVRNNLESSSNNLSYIKSQNKFSRQQSYISNNQSPTIRSLNISRQTSQNLINHNNNYQKKNTLILQNNNTNNTQNNHQNQKNNNNNFKSQQLQNNNTLKNKQFQQNQQNQQNNNNF